MQGVRDARLQASRGGMVLLSKDESILLYAEYGFGDTIQFIRYAPQVRERGGRVIVACKKPIARLMASCPGVEQVVEEGDLLPEFAVYAPLMSLPYDSGNDTFVSARTCAVSCNRRGA